MSEDWHLIDKDDLPGWEHGGDAELRLRDGSVVRGCMMIEELWTGEDEIPLAEFISDDGKVMSLFNAEAEAWRLVSDWTYRPPRR